MCYKQTNIFTVQLLRFTDDVKSNTWFDIVGSGEHRLTRLTIDPLNLMPSRSRLKLKADFFKSTSCEFMEQFVGRR